MRVRIYSSGATYPNDRGHHDADANVPKSRTTVTLDDDVLRAVRVKAARAGKRDSEVIEDALRRYLAFDVLDRIWAKADLNEEEAMQLAVEAQHETRRS